MKIMSTYQTPMIRGETKMFCVSTSKVDWVYILQAPLHEAVKWQINYLIDYERKQLENEVKPCLSLMVQ